MALVISPAHYLVHLQLNLLYQFWLHTELVGKLGPLEWIFNTPTHHQVHHGTTNLITNTFYKVKISVQRLCYCTFNIQEATNFVWTKITLRG